MLSVLLLILKIILLTIAILLGIVIIILLSFLLLPFCYQFYGKYENEGYIEGSVRWILFVIHFKTTYEHEELTYDLKSFGYTIYSNREEWQKKHKKKIRFRKTDEKKNKKDRQEEKQPVGSAIEGSQYIENNYVAEIPKETETKDSLKKKTQPGHETEKTMKKRTILSKCAIILDRIRTILQKLWRLFSFFFYFPWKEFLKQKSTKEALKHICKHLKFLWKGIKPKKFYGEFHFGFEEPDKTGMVLGAIGAGYPVIRKYVKVIPYFNEKILKGSFYGKGKIQVFHIVKTALRVYKDKLLMKKWKQIEKLMEQ